MKLNLDEFQIKLYPLYKKCEKGTEKYIYIHNQDLQLLQE